MKLYRVRHIPSGLFYRGCRDIKVGTKAHSRYVKSNLSKTPHVYHVRPSIGLLSGTFYNHLEADQLAKQWLAKSDQNHLYCCPHKLEVLRPFLSPDWMVEQMGDKGWKEVGNLQ